MKYCPYHKMKHEESAFSGTNGYCRAGLNEYRRLARAKVKAAELQYDWTCPACRRLKPCPRKNATRCQDCINARLFRCACGRKSLGDPTCGKCRYKKRKTLQHARRTATLSRGLNTFTGGARCGDCGEPLHRLPNGNVESHNCV